MLLFMFINLILKNINHTFGWPNAFNEIRFILIGTVLESNFILYGILSSIDLVQPNWLA